MKQSYYVVLFLVFSFSCATTQAQGLTSQAQPQGLTSQEQPQPLIQPPEEALINQMNRFQEGFFGPEEGIYTVETALDAGLFSHETPITFTGFIKTSLGNELYMFEDDTGSIMVEIGDDKWFGLRVNPQTKVVLRGEIDFEFFEKLITVNSVRLVP